MIEELTNTLPDEQNPLLRGLQELLPNRNVKNNPFSLTGRAGSQKNETYLDAESSLELDLLTILEWDPRVERYGVQAVTLKWKDSLGRRREYTPDILVRYHYLALKLDTWLKHTIIEVKPRVVLQRDWKVLRPKFRAAVKACREVGLRFSILTETEIRTPLLSNCRFLRPFNGKQYAMNDATPGLTETITKQLRQLKVSTPAELLAHLSPDEKVKARFLPFIWYLINCNTIICDLTKPLTMGSPIWMVRELDTPAIARRFI